MTAAAVSDLVGIGYLWTGADDRLPPLPPAGSAERAEHDKRHAEMCAGLLAGYAAQPKLVG